MSGGGGIVSPDKVCVTVGQERGQGVRRREKRIRPRTELNESDIIISLTSPAIS